MKLSESPLRTRATNAACILASFAVLITCIFFSYTFLKRPNFGFLLDPYSWEVTRITADCQSDCLQLGDQVLRIGEIDFLSFRNTRSSPLYHSFEVGVGVPFRVLRDGEERTLTVVPLPGTRAEPLDNFLAFFFPLVFWLTGSIAIIFLRPRDPSWFVLIAFWYDVALWTASGFVSATQMSYSSVVFNISIWLFIPLIVHLHLVLPNKILPRFNRWLLPPLYLCTFVFLVLDQLYLLNRSVNLQLWLISIVFSLALLALRYFQRSQLAARVASRLMAFGVAIGLGPFVIILSITLYSDLLPAYNRLIDSVALLVVPIWPLTYLYAIYKQGRGTIEFRANRLLTSYGFFSTYVAFFVAAYFVLYAFVDKHWPSLTEDPVIFSLGTSLLFVALAPSLRKRFQNLVDSFIFGIKYQPETLISRFAERIPTSFNRGVLKNLIVDEVLPTLLIRQSCLCLFDPERPTALYEQEVPVSESAEPIDRQLLDLALERSGRHLSRGRLEPPLDWVRLVVPLSIADQHVGVWLFGRRDPDDFYPRSDISLLTNLANQIAPVSEHVRLVETAQQEIEENQRLQGQLIQSQKMEAVGRLSAGVAHDFNNLLSVIIGYSDLLLTRFRDETSIQQFVGDIRDAGKRASSLTKQLLTFSRQQVMESRVADLNDIVAEVESLLRRVIGEDVRLTAKLASTGLLVRVDPGQIEQVLLNLAVNASDAMPQGGALEIRTDLLKNLQSQPVEGNAQESSDNEFARLTVEDSGTGIAPEVLEHIFEPFFTTKEVGKGTGLGLSMVYGIVSQSGGEIFVDSQVGRGTRFDIYLPLTNDPMTATADWLGEQDNPVTGHGTILVVEDEEIVRKVTCEILRTEGFQVLEASDGHDAQLVFERHRGQIDVLLTDVVMPRVKGPELAQRLLQVEPDLRIVFMSGYNDDQTVDGDSETSWPMIRKPFSPATLTRQIHSILGPQPPADSREV